MASPKTIVITMPGPITSAPRMKTFTNKTSIPGIISMKRPFSMQPREFIQLVKEEIKEGHFMGYEDEDDSKPPRKRQKLDHLSDDQKLLRRKMKNRVAAQSARDRKKVRMDDLEGQVACLTQRVSELVSITEVLTQHNAKLESEAASMRKKMSQCTCIGPNQRTKSSPSTNLVPLSINIKNGNSISSRLVPTNVENKVVATIKAPVSSATERSAEGGCTGGSSSGLVCGGALFAAGEGTDGGKYQRVVKLNGNRTAQIGGRRENVHVKGSPIRLTVRSVGKLGRTPSAPVEEQTRLRPVEKEEPTLTQEEEDMVTQLTQLLEKSIAQKSSHSPDSTTTEALDSSLSSLPNTDSFSFANGSTDAPTTPDIMLDMLNFDNQDQVTGESKDRMADVSKQDILDFLQAPDDACEGCCSPSPVTASAFEEALLDSIDTDTMLTSSDVHFNEFGFKSEIIAPICSSPSLSSYGSESGYDSVSSPHSISTESSLEVEDFLNELFPSLF